MSATRLKSLLALGLLAVTLGGAGAALTAGQDRDPSTGTPPRAEAPAGRPVLEAEGRREDRPEDRPAPAALAQNWEARKLLTVNSEVVSSLAFSPDGRTLVGCVPGEVRGWDSATGEQRFAFAWKNVDPMFCLLAVSPDGKTLAAVERGSGARVWDLAADRQKLALDWPRAKADDDVERPALAVESAAVSADGRRAATGHSDGLVRVWDLTRGEELGSFRPGGRAPVPAVAVSPDGDMVAALVKGQPTFWDAETGRQLRAAPARRPLAGLRELRYAAGGKTLMAVTGDGVQLWDVKGSVGPFVAVGAVPLRGLALSPDGKTLAVARTSERLKLLDAATGATVATLPWVSFPAVVAYSPDGRSLASPRGPRVRVWSFEGRGEVVAKKKERPQPPDPPEVKKPPIVEKPPVAKPGAGKELRTITAPDRHVFGLTFSPDGKTLIGMSSDHIRGRDVVSGEERFALGWHGVDPFEVRPAVSPDGRTLAAADRYSGARAWDLRSRKLLASVAWPRPKVDPDVGSVTGSTLSAAVSDNGRRAASGDSEGVVRLWDLTTGKEVAQIRTRQRGLRELALSPDGKTVLTFDRGDIRQWDVASGEELARRKGKKDFTHAEAIQYTPDGRYFMAVGSDGVLLWEAATNEDWQFVRCRPAGGAAVALSPDGKRLLVAPHHDRVLLLDVATGKVLTTFHWVSRPASVAFSPDGRTVASTREGRIRLWDVRPGSEE